jgi:hypothetical protein
MQLRRGITQVVKRHDVYYPWRTDACYVLRIHEPLDMILEGFCNYTDVYRPSPIGDNRGCTRRCTRFDTVGFYTDACTNAPVPSSCLLIALQWGRNPWRGGWRAAAHPPVASSMTLVSAPAASLFLTVKRRDRWCLPVVLADA